MNELDSFFEGASGQYQLFPPLTSNEYEELKADIALRGLMVPIEKDEEGNVLDGFHRLKICEELGLTDYPVVIRPGLTHEQKMEHALTLNLARRHLSEEQRKGVVSRLRLEGWSYPRIAERLNISPMTAWRDATLSNDKVEQPERTVGKDGKSRPAILVTDRKQEGTLLTALQVGLPDSLSTGAAEHIITGRDAVKAIKEQERREDIDRQKAAIESGVNTADGTYDVVSIDPPWPYGTEYDPDGRRAANPYPEMSLDEIMAIDIPATDNCVLWLWTTHKFMRHSFALLDKWGFRDVAILTWVKDRMGLGTWLRSQSEFCIMAVKGSPLINLTNQTTVLEGPLREHSRKPDSFYEMVNGLCVGRKLDYFSRQARDGWDQFGNDTGRFEHGELGG